MSLWALKARTKQDPYIFLLVLVLLIALAWLALIVWGQSPYGRYLDHDALAGVALADSPQIVLLAVTGWVLMIVAMMLPTTLPLITLFRTVVRQRADRTRLVVLLLAGYLGIWSLFGLAIHLGDLGLHQVVDRIGWLSQNAWIIGAATLVGAGLYQFTPLKYHCLDKCRSPLSFITQYWRGRREHLQAFRLGVHHGLFCIGCCWTLMLLMFAVGIGNLGWMLVLGAVMAIEKNFPWGRRLSVPLGMTLLVLGVSVIVIALTTGPAAA